MSLHRQWKRPIEEATLNLACIITPVKIHPFNLALIFSFFLFFYLIICFWSPTRINAIFKILLTLNGNVVGHPTFEKLLNNVCLFFIPSNRCIFPEKKHVHLSSPKIQKTYFSTSTQTVLVLSAEVLRYPDFCLNPKTIEDYLNSFVVLRASKSDISKPQQQLIFPETMSGV